MKRVCISAFCLAVLGLVITFFTFSACEVGLGESVDTQAPKIAITYPEGKSVVCDMFVLAGECSDDQNVASVSVTVQDAENNPVDYVVAAPKIEAAADGGG